MYSCSVDDNSEYKKVKGLNRNIVATTSNKEYKDVLLNNKYLRHSMNRIQSKYHRTGTYEIKKFHCFFLMTKYIFKTIDMMD